MKSIDIRSESAVKLLSEFLDMEDGPYVQGDRHRNAEHFAHEVYSYLRSPYRDLVHYDAAVQYDTPPDIPPPPERESERHGRWRRSSISRSPRRDDEPEAGPSRVRSREDTPSPHSRRSRSRTRTPVRSRSPSRDIGGRWDGGGRQRVDRRRRQSSRSISRPRSRRDTSRVRPSGRNGRTRRQSFDSTPERLSGQRRTGNDRGTVSSTRDKGKGKADGAGRDGRQCDGTPDEGMDFEDQELRHKSINDRSETPEYRRRVQHIDLTEGDLDNPIHIDDDPTEQPNSIPPNPVSQQPTTHETQTTRHPIPRIPRSLNLRDSVQAHLSGSLSLQRRNVIPAQGSHKELKPSDFGGKENESLDEGAPSGKPSLRLSDQSPLDKSSHSSVTEESVQPVVSGLSAPSIMARTRLRLAKMKGEPVAGYLPTSTTPDGQDSSAVVNPSLAGARATAAATSPAVIAPDIRSKLLSRLEEEKRQTVVVNGDQLENGNGDSGQCLSGDLQTPIKGYPDGFANRTGGVIASCQTCADELPKVIDCDRLSSRAKVELGVITKSPTVGLKEGDLHKVAAEAGGGDGSAEPSRETMLKERLLRRRIVGGKQRSM
ncbi:hypothetical protein JAAARDRAFT_499560 [Jaapia argillacea MUCL 33604]|uniref:Uncharacterized protein n=1 Tax=Jaapia argillacea MUCL 33604 TaxID=933084 RepID=A0A067PL87_9AGAM|nr:hypothetical protein JAAARDRAFT_499560 [Jaapia argillacea MUCL 33604]